ncbi:MAG: acyl-CoA dehydrogenase family protein, partial [Chloroflexota bacterium]
MDFTVPEHVTRIVHRVEQFIEREVIPIERVVLQEQREVTMDEIQSLRQKAKAEGIWAPTMPKDLGGLGLNISEFTPVLEAAGRSLLGPSAIHCAAPDEGNMHMLHTFANDKQTEKYLRPLVAGEVFSAFSMTEPPPGAGSDPRMVQSRAVKDGDEWVINGHKWYTSNGEIADFFFIMAVTDPDVHPYSGTSIFIADRDTAGMNIIRDVPTMGLKDFGGHVEIKYDNVRLPESAILGELGQGFSIAQVRLAPARLTHCMRWTGIAQRALEIATQYANKREAFGKKLIEHQSVAFALADSEIELYQARLMMQHAAWLLTQGEQARSETSMAKVTISETVHRVIDRCIQICG